MQCAVTMQSNYYAKDPTSPRGPSLAGYPPSSNQEFRRTQAASSAVRRVEKPPPPSKPDTSAGMQVRMQRANAARMGPANGQRRPPLPVPRVDSPTGAQKQPKPMVKVLQRGGSVLDEMILAKASPAMPPAVPPTVQTPPPRGGRPLQSSTVRGSMTRSSSAPEVSSNHEPLTKPRPPSRRAPLSQPSVMESDEEDGDYIDPNEVHRAVKLPPARPAKPSPMTSSPGRYLTAYPLLGPDGRPRRPPKRSESEPSYLQPDPPKSSERRASYIEMVNGSTSDDEEYTEPFDDGLVCTSPSPAEQSPAPTADEQAGYHILERTDRRPRSGTYEAPHDFSASTSPRHSYYMVEENNDPNAPYADPRQFTGGDADDDDYEYNDPLVGSEVEESSLPILDGEPTAWFHGAITRKEAEVRLENASPGAYLLRIGERHLGYSLSIRHAKGFRHYAIDQLSDTKYELRGNGIIHKSVHTLVLYFYHNPINAQQERLRCPCVIRQTSQLAKR